MLALLSGVTLLGAGCSGISTSHSVSPATFLVPGFFGQTPPVIPVPLGPNAGAVPVEPAQAFAPAN